MFAGTDIFIKLIEEPTIVIDHEKRSVETKFQDIIQTQKTILENELKPSQPIIDDTNLFSDKKQIPDPIVSEPTKKKETSTLRVDVTEIDHMVGLSGDMAINLSSFESSLPIMTDTLNEFNIILKRLKNINASLEAGYELATIPHIGGLGEINSDTSSATEDFDPLEMDRYSELNVLIRSLSEAVVDLDSIMDQSVTVNDSWQKAVERQRGVLGEIQNSMVGIRMAPLSVLSGRLHMTVRETVRATGHKARLIIEGESIRMDTRVWDTMADPLMHILRNAVAHGLTAKNSDEKQEGTRIDNLLINIKGSRQGGLFTLQIKDNGQGLDFEAIRTRGMELYPHEDVESMTNEELADLIFRHGFSSASSITDIVGRGVGMDIVRKGVEQLNGTIDIFSEEGKGVELIIQIPVAVAQLSAILAKFGSHVCAVPMRDVDNVVRISREKGVDEEYEFNGEMVPLFHPSQIMMLQDNNLVPSSTGFSDDTAAILLIDVGGKRGAMYCDEIIGRKEIIFKDLGTHLKSVPCVAGATIMGDGTIVPILQSEELLSKWKVEDHIIGVKKDLQRIKERVLRILFADDSISVRKVLSNFTVQQGWRPVEARDGIEAIEKIRENKPDFILLDIEMPRMNGFEVLQTLQGQPAYRNIPVVMLTSRSGEKYKEKASSLGASGFVTKPFEEKELAALIKEMTE